MFGIKVIQQILTPPKQLNEALLYSILNSTTDAIVTIDRHSVIIEWNRAAEVLFGFKREEAVGEKLTNLILPRRFISKHRLGVKTYLREGQSNIIGKRTNTVAVTKDGSEIPVELSIQAVEYNRGTIFTASIKDLTEISKEEEKKTLFMQELNHRIKNLMSVVQAIAQLTLPLNNEDKSVFTSRLFAMSKAQDLIFKSDWKEANLNDLVVSSTYSFVNPEKFEMFGNKNIVIPANTAVTFALVIYELMTNAIKYGSLRKDYPDGKVRITAAHVNKSIVWSWEEVGGPPISAPEEKGFGTKLITRSFSGEGTSHIEYNSTGLKCVVVLDSEKIDKALNPE